MARNARRAKGQTASAGWRARAASLRLAARRLLRRHRRRLPLLACVCAVFAFYLLSATCGDALWRLALPAPTAGYVRPRATPAPIDWALVRGDTAPAVWASESGGRYHAHAACSGMVSASELTLHAAWARGLFPCSRCWP